MITGMRSVLWPPLWPSVGYPMYESGISDGVPRGGRKGRNGRGVELSYLCPAGWPME